MNEAHTLLLQLPRQCSRLQTTVTESDHFNKRILRFRSQRNNEDRGHLSRGVKNTDHLKTMFAVGRYRETSSLPFHHCMESGRPEIHP